MSSVKAVFKKQFKGTVNNPEILMQFIIYPLLALVLNLLVVTDFEGIPYEIAAMLTENMPNMVTMQATIFVGMGIITVMGGIVAADIEKKSIRFLMMAGVKPGAYLLGVSGVILLVSIGTSAAFSLIGEFSGTDFWIFTAAMMSATVCSVILGATIGIITKNQQSASAISLPLAAVLAFGPMMAQFNDVAARFLHPVYTQHLNVIAAYLKTGGNDMILWQSFAIILANAVLLSILFAIAYTKKGMKN